MPERSKGSSRVPYGSARDALVQATIRLVARDGLSKLTNRALTREAGVSQGSLQHHFPSTTELLAAALSYCVQTTLAYLAPPTSPHAIFEALHDALRNHPEAAAFQTELFLEARRHPDLFALVKQHQATYSENLRTTLESLKLPADEELVQLLMATGDGIAYQFAVFGIAHLDVSAQQVAGLRRLLNTHIGVLLTSQH